MRAADADVRHKNMFSIFRRLFSKKSDDDRSPLGEVTCDSDIIKYSRPKHEDILIPFKQVTQISIVTTDWGPFEEDVFFTFCISERTEEELIPQGAKGTDALLSLISRLERYDDSKVIEAMGCTSNARFICWKK